MNDLTIRTLDASKTISEETLAAFAGKLRGEAALPGEDGYEAARTIWNAMIDRRPALAARCRGPADVIHALKFAREEKLLVAVRGGGHNIAGSAVCDGGLLIDLSPMRSVRVDPSARIARVEAGATLADFDREAQAFALATPLGINSTTGVAGLTLGGGFGWTTRKFGLTIDNLVSADLVTADGEFMRVSESEHPDLFWALRGGGGNFGVVTSFEFRLHPLGPEVLSGLVVHPLDEAEALLPEFRRIVNEAPDELSVWSVMRKAPPLPFLPAEWHGKEVLIFAACYAGDMAEGEKADPRAALARAPDRRRRLAPFVRPLARRVRSASDGGGAQLLEEPRFRRPLGGRDCSYDPRGARAALARVRGFRSPPRRRDGPRYARGDGLASSQSAFCHERARALARASAGFHLHRMGARTLRGGGSIRVRRRLRQFHAGGRASPCGERLWRELSPAGRDQAPLRS